jgi:hypothetical protein
MPADMNQLLALKDLLHKFSLSTGLKVNFHKSNIIPINVEDNLVQDFVVAIGC